MSWNDRYLQDDFPWDLGAPAPILTDLAERALSSGSRVIVVGCGRGWDVESLADRGHHAVGLDIAPAALDHARQRIAARAEPPPGSATFVVGDVLVGEGPPDAGDGYDAWFEHTCYCALDPSRSPAYAASAARRLKPGGVLLGAFLDFEGGGPPWGTSAESVRRVFEPLFEIEHLARSAHAFSPRGVPQLAAIFRRR